MALQDSFQQMSKFSFLLLGAAIAVGFHFSLVDESEKVILQNNTLRSKIQESESKLKEALNKTQNKERFQEEMDRVSTTLRMALEYLPKELDIQDLLKKIYSEARTAGVDMSKFKPKDSLTKDFYEELAMEIEIKGNYTQLVTFLAAVSKIPRIINIRNVEIAKPTLIDGYPSMTMTGILVGYRYKEK